MLIERTLYGEENKVERALALIREREPPDGYYVAFSGGKDSVVLYDLMERSGVRFDAHHNITTVEAPELMRFIKRNYPLVADEHPKRTMYELIVYHQLLPTRTVRFCCKELKERGGVGRCVVTGIRAEESRRRAKRGEYEPNRAGGWYLHPILSWSRAEVWEYIRGRRLPYCELYDEGFERLGCVLCPFQTPKQVDRDLERFPGIVRYYKSACRAAYERRLEQGKPVEHDSAEAWFEWWVHVYRRRRIIEDCNQIPLFSEDDGWLL